MLYMNLQVKEMLEEQYGLFRMVYDSCLVVLASVCLCELVILRKKTTTMHLINSMRLSKPVVSF